MKQIKKILKWAVLIVFLLIALGELGDWLLLSKPDILQSKESPDGKYVAYVYESNGGATTYFTYHLSILPKWIPLGRGAGNTWVEDYPPLNIEWIGDRELLVDVYRGDKHKKKTWVWGVDIVYTNYD